MKAQYCLPYLLILTQTLMAQTSVELLATRARAGDKAALVAIERAVALRDDQAMYELGRLYDSGNGVSLSHTRARKLYEMSAEMGNPIAMFQLFILYDTDAYWPNGEPHPMDWTKAREWLLKAANAGCINAMRVLSARHYRGINGVKNDQSMAYIWSCVHLFL